ncbi:hypothetical protein E8E13_000434 [Curvularia kusanoi]|uniref:PA14 domain-containing protein n=1 Tax=Curvularia kusanoi TaxID=90978 RepID=A0A9P4T3F5_CURKU|nr:hypothetical protein E8E13_000434 [Curvularia kusanoi]
MARLGDNLIYFVPYQQWYRPTTVTLTATATTGGIASPVVNVILPSCTNTGIRYYDLDNPFLTTLFNPFYPNFVVEYFKNSSLPANYVGYADNINFVLPWTGDSQILSMPQRNNTFTTLVFQGYFAPTLTGVWNFTLFSNDDVTDIWMGPEAYSDWQTSNRLLRGTRGNINSYVANFLAGQYIPLTIVYANGPQTGALQLGITGPDNVYRNSTAGLFKWPSCAGDSFIKYPVNSPSPAPSSTTTITSGSVAFTSVVPTTIGGIATQVAIVGVPTPSTTTITSGSVAFTSIVPTTISGVATQVAVVGVPTPTCTATGLTYNAYTNPFLYPVGAGAADPSYSGFNATYFNGLPASSVLYSGATNNISFNVPAAGGNLYGSPRTFIQTAIVYTGYFVPPVSGTYRLGFSSTDDVGYLWMGLPASAGTWGENNWNVRSTFFAPSTATVSQNFIAGQLYPIVIAVANGGGDGGLQFGIVTPAGSTVTDTTGYFLQPSCSTSGLTLATVQPSTGPGTPSRITITSGSVAFTSTVPTTISGVATQVAIVGVPALSTITITSGASLFTSTSTATVAGVATNVAVVVQPQTPFHIYVTDFSSNVYGYLDLNSSPVLAGTYNVSNTTFAGSSLFYLDAATGQLAASPASGSITQPLYSVQTAGSPNSPLLFSTNQPTANTPVLVGQWPDGTLRLANTANVAQAASLCNGLLFVQPAVTAGCTQVVLSPVYNAVNYTTVTVTSGPTPATRTYGPAGTLVSSGGTVTDFVPAPTCTATGLAYAAYTNPFTGGATNTNPYYTNYNATFFNSAVVGPALYSGVTNNINFNFGTGAGTLYGTPRTLAQTSLVYRGYFRTPSTGTYALNFPLSTLDDIAYVWMGGAVANNTWGESNWNLRATYNVVRGGSLTQNFIAGQLYPIVIEYGNAPGGAVLQINIVTPSGVTVTDTTGYFVQPSCASSGSSIGSSSVDITTCSATGIEWSLHTNAVLGGSTILSPNYSLFVPELYNGATSPPTLAGGIVGNIQLGIAAPATAATLYNQGPYDMTQKAIIFRGYFAANVTGTWTFTFANPDEAAYMWLGPNAVSTWSKANANLFGSLNGAIGTYTISLTAGTLYPIRMVMANAGGAMSFTLQTTDPLNVTLVGHDQMTD